LFDFDIHDDRFVRDDDATLLGHPSESLGCGPSLDRRSRSTIDRRSLATLDELVGILLVTEGSLQHLHIELACIAVGIRLWALALRQDHVRRVSPSHFIPAWNLIRSRFLLRVARCILIVLNLIELNILIDSSLRKEYTPL